MIKQDFGIQIEDGSLVLPDLVTEENRKAVDLYYWQMRAIRYFFEHNNKAVFEVTTGAGKTFCAIEIIKQVMQEKKDLMVLIVVPKNVILEQTWFKELYENGFSMKDVGVFYGFTKEYGRIITITNMQNLEKITLEIFDMVIFDEIHNYGTRRLLPFVAYPFKYKLGLSATTERTDGSHWKIFEIFDYNIFKYTPQEALQDEVLNPFNFTNIAIEMNSDSYGKYEELTQELTTIFRIGGGFMRIMRSNHPIKLRMLKKLNERKQLISNYPLKFQLAQELAEKHKGDKIIFFNEFNEQTSKLYWYLLDVGVKARVMHSGIPYEKRDKNLRDMKHDRANVLCASKVIDEGWNMPAVDVAVIMAGESSDRQTIQRFGRVLRKKKKISHIYQIYCRGTVEQRYAARRSRLFKELCNEYKEYVYSG